MRRTRLLVLASLVGLGVGCQGEGATEREETPGDACAQGQVLCGSVCTSTGTDPANCGACGTPCLAGEQCAGGSCVCVAGLTRCGLACVEVETDPANCGGCGTVCTAGAFCAQGQCVTECPSGTTPCGQSCVDVATSSLHCGGCDQACPTGRTCTGGVCGCPAPLVDCGSYCADTSQDPAHCGLCNVQCPGGTECAAGVCAGGGTGGSGSGGAPTGGASTGGVATGGTPTGGAATGGVATGGTPTGGVTTGGVATGGVATGGVATGGTPTGGAATGGVATGGVATGGVATGGVATGGAPTGGVATGGTATGGAATGGTGGTSTGTPGCNATTWPASGTYEIDVGGTPREFIFTLPTGYVSSTAYPVVFGWHWRGGTATNVATNSYFGGNYYGLRTAARGQSTMIFLAPQGLGTSADPTDYGWPNTNGQDVAFARAMITWLETNYCIDVDRIFSTGFSYGGMMSDTVGCQMADVFRAIAPIAGAAFGGSYTCGASTGPVAAWMTHGTADEPVPIASGEAARDLYLAKNHCDTTTHAVTPEPCVTYEGCDSGYPVTWCAHSGDHTIPSFAAQAIWDFFSQF